MNRNLVRRTTRQHRRLTYVQLISHETLAAIAKQKGVGPVRMARYAGHKDHSYISRMLRGLPGTRTVTDTTANRIAELLDVPVGVLFQVKEVKSHDRTAA